MAREGLADGVLNPTKTPLTTTLNNTELFSANIALPLSFVSATQVNALIPQKLIMNTVYPLPVTLAELQPGIFTTLGTGSG
jgi:uncharacterized protein (TIGR03437 family)